MQILYFGNPYIEEDSLAIKIAEKLKTEFSRIEFKYIKDAFQLLDMNLNNAVLLDVAEGISKVALLSINDLSSNFISTTHDFDLGFFLKATEKNSNIKIIGIPKTSDLEKSAEEIREIIHSSLLSKNE